MDFSIYEHTPGVSVIVLPDAPVFTHVAVSNDFVRATGMKREDVVGKGHFEVFSQSPDDPGASGALRLRASFEHIIRHREPHEIPVQRYDIPTADGRFAKKYWKINNAPVLDENGAVRYIIHSAVEVTARVLAEQQASELQEVARQNEELLFVMNFMPQMVWHTLPDGTADFFNQVFLNYTGLRQEQLTGSQWIALLHPDDKIITIDVWQQALASSLDYQVEHRLRGKDGTYRWFLTRGRPLTRDNGEVVKWYGTTTDIQERKTLEEALEQRVQERTAGLERQKAFVSSILDASISGVLALDAIRNEAGQMVDFRIAKINKAFTSILGLDGTVIGKSYLEHFPYSTKNGIFDMYREVLETGIPVRKEFYSEDRQLDSWFDISAAKRDENGIVVTFANVSEQRMAALQIAEQKKLLDSILAHSPAGITVYQAIRNPEGQTVDFSCIVANEAAGQFTGISTSQRFDKTVLEITPALKDTPLFRMAIATLETGTPFRSEYQNNQTGQWLELSVVKMDADHLINVFRDITSIKETQHEIERSAERFKAVFNVSQTGMFTFAPVYNEAGEVVDFRFVITNPNFAAYVGQTPEVLNGALGSTWFPGYLTNGVFDMYKHTLLTGETRRVDIHYNVDQHDIYLDLQSTKLGDEVLVTFNDYTPLKRVQLQLEKTVEDLKVSNQNLEDFAYAASHDMKEPIRKIHFYADLLRQSLADRLRGNERHHFERMELAARRMGTLIDDLLFYSYVTRGAAFEEAIDLNKKVALVLEDLELEVQERNARISVAPLPTIRGHRRQLQQLFHNLIGNALKYSKPDVTPEIRISAQVVYGHETQQPLPPKAAGMQYHLITVTDNGIGFDQQDAKRIFNVFTRLHGNAEYRGAGVGLSIVQKVVENHRGYIWAESEPGKGTAFMVLLPVA